MSSLPMKCHILWIDKGIFTTSKHCLSAYYGCVQENKVPCLSLIIRFYFIHFSRLNLIFIILLWENTGSANENYQVGIRNFESFLLFQYVTLLYLLPHLTSFFTSYLTLPYVLPYLIICLILLYLTLPYLTVPYVLPYHTTILYLPLTLPYLTIPYVLPYLTILFSFFFFFCLNLQ